MSEPPDTPNVAAGLVLHEATSEEFLPPVQLWVKLSGIALLGSFLAALVLMAIWPYRVVVRGVGMVRPAGETSVINAPFAARVRRVLVQPNERVRTGQVLAVLDPADLEGKREQFIQSTRALDLQARALIQQGEAALQSAAMDVEKSQAALVFAEAEYGRFAQLAGTGSITTSQLQEKLANYNMARANLAKAQEVMAEQRSRNLKDQAELQKELANTRADAGQIARDLAKTSLTAPVPGVLFSLNLRNPGQMVAAGEELARIAPSQAGLLVKVLVPSQDITNVETGQRADLRISGCPYPDFGTLRAKVLSIAPEATQPPAEGEPPRGRSNTAVPPTPTALPGGFEVTLLPQGTLLRSGDRKCELRLGMDLSADITTRVETVLQFLLRKTRLTTGV